MKSTSFTLYTTFLVALLVCISIVTANPIHSAISDFEVNLKDPSTVISAEEDAVHLENHKTKKDSNKKASKRDINRMASKLQNTKRGLSSCYKRATLTQYWIPKQGDKDMLNNGNIVTLSGSKSKSLKTTSGSVIAKVSKTTYEVYGYILQFSITTMYTNPPFFLYIEIPNGRHRPFERWCHGEFR
jgi:hypothetical protein